MTNILERLRREQAILCPDGSPYLAGEAADYIDDLRCKVLRLTRERDDALMVMASGCFDAALAHQTGVHEHGLALAVERLRTADARIAAQEAEIERLREALKPFAVIGAHYEHAAPDCPLTIGPLTPQEGMSPLFFRDFHAARAALEPKR